ncbi:uncharacterized protein LOC115221725 [Argonauta hians]
MADRTLRSAGDGKLTPSPNGHSTPCKLTKMECKKNCLDQKDAPRKSQCCKKSGSQCQSKAPLPNQSALSDYKTYKDSVDPEEENGAKMASSQKSKANPQPSYHLESPLRSCQKQSDSRFLRCELCNKLFSEDDNGEDAHLSKKKITICRVCNQKYSSLEDNSDKKPSKQVLDTSLLPKTHPPKLINDNCNNIPSRNNKEVKNGSPTSVSSTEHLIKNIKQEPPSDPAEAIVPPNVKLPLQHKFQSSCSFYLTTNLKPCIKRNQEAKQEKKDSVPSENNQTKKARIGESPLAKTTGEEPHVTGNVSKTTATSSPVPTKVLTSTEANNQNHTKSEPSSGCDGTSESNKTVDIKPKITNDSDFKFKLPTVSSSYSTGKNVNKSKSDSTSNTTYTFEGSMMWNPVTSVASKQEPQKPDKKEGISESKSHPKKETKDDESTYSCEGSLFIKPVLPNEFAFEGTLYIKPDSPHLPAHTAVQSPPATSSNCPSNSSTNKVVNIQSVFTSSGQVISSVTVPGSEGNGKVPTNQRLPVNVSRTAARTTTTNSTVGPRMTSSIPTPMPKVGKIPAESKRDLPVKKPSLNCTSVGGHTDFSVKSILSTPDRRGTAGNCGKSQEQ